MNWTWILRWNMIITWMLYYIIEVIYLDGICWVSLWFVVIYSIKHTNILLKGDSLVSLIV